jgi:hypothetical protein
MAGAAVRVVRLGVDACIAACHALGTGARPVDAGQIADTTVLAGAAVLLVVPGIDAERATEDLGGGTAATLTPARRARVSALALSIDAATVGAAGLTAPTAVQGVCLRADAGLATFDRAILAFFLLLFRVFLGGSGWRKRGPKSGNNYGQAGGKPATAPVARQVLGQAIETLGIHGEAPFLLLYKEPTVLRRPWLLVKIRISLSVGAAARPRSLAMH